MLDVLAVRDEHVGDQARGEEPVIDDAGGPVEACRQLGGVVERPMEVRDDAA